MPGEILIDKHNALYFVAIVAPEPVAKEVMKIKREFAENYNSKKPLNSPPHITLINPFLTRKENILIIEKSLKEFSINQKPFSIHLSGFDAFPPNTIFIKNEPNEKLQALNRQLYFFVLDNLNPLSKFIKKIFTPHMTVGYRDLTKENFKKAWQAFEKRKFDGTFEVDKLILLRHNGRHWETFCELPFGTTVV